MVPTSTSENCNTKVRIRYQNLLYILRQGQTYPSGVNQKQFGTDVTLITIKEEPFGYPFCFVSVRPVKVVTLGIPGCTTFDSVTSLQSQIQTRYLYKDTYRTERNTEDVYT